MATHIVVSPIRENGLGSVGGAQCRGNANGRPDHLADLSPSTLSLGKTKTALFM